MSIWLTVYLYGAGILFTSAIPVLGECIVEVFNSDESTHNRQASGLWILALLFVFATWPVTFTGLLLWAGILSIKDKVTS